MEMSSSKFIRRLTEASDLTAREGVAAVFRERVGGVEARAAHERTKAFYRSSRHDWALAMS